MLSDAPSAAVVQHPEFYVVNAGLFIKTKTHEDHLCGVPGKKHSCRLYGSFSSEGWDNVCTLGCSWWCRIASYSLATMQLGTHRPTRLIDIACPEMALYFLLSTKVIRDRCQRQYSKQVITCTIRVSKCGTDKH